MIHFDQSKQNYCDDDESDSLSSITSASFTDYSENDNESRRSDIKEFQKLVDIVMTRL